MLKEWREKCCGYCGWTWNGNTQSATAKRATIRAIKKRWMMMNFCSNWMTGFIMIFRFSVDWFSSGVEWRVLCKSPGRCKILVRQKMSWEVVLFTERSSINHIHTYFAPWKQRNCGKAMRTHCLRIGVGLMDANLFRRPKIKWWWWQLESFDHRTCDHFRVSKQEDAITKNIPDWTRGELFYWNS